MINIYVFALQLNTNYILLHISGPNDVLQITKLLVADASIPSMPHLLQANEEEATKLALNLPRLWYVTGNTKLKFILPTYIHIWIVESPSCVYYMEWISLFSMQFYIVTSISNSRKGLNVWKVRDFIMLKQMKMGV